MLLSAGLAFLFISAISPVPRHFTGDINTSEKNKPRFPQTWLLPITRMLLYLHVVKLRKWQESTRGRQNRELGENTGILKVHKSTYLRIRHSHNIGIFSCHFKSWNTKPWWELSFFSIYSNRETWKMLELQAPSLTLLILFIKFMIYQILLKFLSIWKGQPKDRIGSWHSKLSVDNDNYGCTTHLTLLHRSTYKCWTLGKFSLA